MESLAKVPSKALVALMVCLVAFVFAEMCSRLDGGVSYAHREASAACLLMGMNGTDVDAAEFEAELPGHPTPQDVRRAMHRFMPYGLAHDLTGRSFEMLPMPCMIWVDGACIVLVGREPGKVLLAAGGEPRGAAGVRSVEQAYARNGWRAVYCGAWGGAEVLESIERPPYGNVQSHL